VDERVVVYDLITVNYLQHGTLFILIFKKVFISGDTVAPSLNRPAQSL
jgi:hypothetical protein